MKKNLLFIVGLHLILASAVIFVASASKEASAAITVCDSGDSLSYDQAKDALASGELFITHWVDLAESKYAMTIDNNTPCNLPASLASYKMFGPYNLDTQSQQEFFDGTHVYNVASHSTEVLRVNLPRCAAQYDLWYGDAPRVIENNQPYGTMLLGDQVAQGSFCEPPPAPPSDIIASVIAPTCAAPGSSFTITGSADGTGVTSNSLEQDSNQDGVYGSIASVSGAGETSATISIPATGAPIRYDIQVNVNNGAYYSALARVYVSDSCTPTAIVSAVTPLFVPVTVIPPVVTPVAPPPVAPPPATSSPSVAPPPVVIVTVVTPPPSGGGSRRDIPPSVTITTVMPIETINAASTELRPNTSGSSRRSQPIILVAEAYAPEVSFPDTGFAPREGMLFRNLAMLTGFLALTFGIFGLTKKQIKT